MKILNIVNSLHTGGLESLVVDMAVMVNSTPGNMEFLILPIDDASSFLREKARKGNVKIIEAGKHSFVTRVRNLIANVKSEKIDIIHTHNSRPLRFGILASRYLRIPIVHTKHGNYIPQKLCLNYWTSRLAYHLSDKIVAVSQGTKKSIVHGFKISANRIVVVPNGINTEVFKPKNRISDPTDKVFTIGCVGRLSPEKGHSLLLEAFALAVKSGFSLKLLIVGKGASEKDLLAKAKALNIINYIEFLGERSDVPDIMQSFDIYAQTSLMEGMSLTLLEAMAAGLPIVATNVGGNPEVVIDGETGILVSPKEPNKMAEAIVKMLTNPELAKRMGEAGRKRVVEKFSLDRMVGEYEKLYKECLDKK